MNAYTISLFALVLGLLGQSVVSGMAFERCFHRAPALGSRALWLAIAIGSLLLGLHHGHSIELALKTGLYDLRQASLAGGAGLLYAYAMLAFSRRA
jgi:hypothetical protein